MWLALAHARSLLCEAKAWLPTQVYEKGFDCMAYKQPHMWLHSLLTLIEAILLFEANELVGGGDDDR